MVVRDVKGPGGKKNNNRGAHDCPCQRIKANDCSVSTRGTTWAS